jgi:hypothetical protein
MPGVRKQPKDCPALPVNLKCSKFFILYLVIIIIK